MSFNFTPLDQAYQLHHINPNTYSSITTAKYSPICMFCGNKNSVSLMELQDRGAFRQCVNPSCRKQFQATILTPPVTNYQTSTSTLPIIQRNENPKQPQQPQQPQQKTQFEPQFISKFKQ